MEMGEFLKRIGMAREETEEILRLWEMLRPYREQIEMLAAQCGERKSFTEAEAEIGELANLAGVPYDTVYGFVLCLSGRWLREDFQAAGYPESIYWDTVSDLAYKMRECRQVRKVWGVFAGPGWYNKYFQMRVLKLGRLEFERMIYHGETYARGDLVLRDGDFVCNVHIPSCGPLTRDSRMDSYRKAYDFFAKERGGRPLVCVCSSWLLYPKHREIFPSHMNMADFLNDWDIVSSGEDPEFKNAWRLFGCEYNGDPAALPQDNTARRAMAQWLLKGHSSGTGKGVLFFDGEKIVK